jgi:hypothetical protein
MKHPVLVGGCVGLVLAAAGGGPGALLLALLVGWMWPPDDAFAVSSPSARENHVAAVHVAVVTGSGLPWTVAHELDSTKVPSPISA